MWLLVSAGIILGNNWHDTHFVAIAEWVASTIVNDANIDLDAIVFPWVSESCNTISVNGITNVSGQPEEGKSDVV